MNPYWINHNWKMKLFDKLLLFIFGFITALFLLLFSGILEGVMKK
jgi:hypothetical protein